MIAARHHSDQDINHLAHDLAQWVSLDWELLVQAAQAAKNAELLGLAKRCHPQTLRQMRCANAILKELSAQTLVS